METSTEALEDYQFGNLKDFDFVKIFEILKTIKEEMKISSLDITKSYVNSLFTPLLSFSIDYLNENEEKLGIIGKSTVDGLEVIYLVLNKSVYDLFFQRKKGSVFGSKNQINYERNYEEDNYLITDAKEEKELDAKMIEDIILFGETNKEPNKNSLKEIFNFKKKEIISSFRLGYSIQERIMNTLISNADNKILELPNVIFYKKNKYNRIYNEVDRIITVEKETKINNFMVFSRTKFQTNKEPTTIKVAYGEILTLQKNSCNFIEIKTSMNHLSNKNKNQFNYGYFHTTLSQISSIHSSENTETSNENKMCKNIQTFCELFKSFNKYFKTINLIIIIDSFFLKKYINMADTFGIEMKRQTFDFNLIFVHIEPDFTYASELDNYQKIQENYEQLKTNLQIKETKMATDSAIKKKEIQKLKQDSEDKNKEILALNNKINKLSSDMSKMKNDLNEFVNEKIKKKIKKAIRKKPYNIYLNNKIKENETLINKSNSNYIIGNYYNNSFLTRQKLGSYEKQFNVLIDFKTFIRLTYSKENMRFIKDIEDKYWNKLKELSEFKINKLILLVDFVFFSNINDIMNTYFKDKNVIINPIFVESDILFLLTFSDKKTSNSNFIFNENILSFERINMKEVSKILNFINYYCQINNSIGKNNLVYFPLYNPIEDRNHYFFSIITTSSLKEEIVALICKPLIDFEDLSLQMYKEQYKYIIILFQSYYFEIREDICNIISKFYFKKNAEFIIPLPEIQKIIFENEKKLLTFFGDASKKNVAIIDKLNNRIPHKFRVVVEKNNNNNYPIDLKNIIDKKINIIFENIKIKNKETTKILIEEQYNLIYTYFHFKYDKSNIVLLNAIKNEGEQDIRKIITTNEITGINQYLFEYMNQNPNELFDLIISVENVFFEKESSVKHKFLKKDRLMNIKSHLKEKGIFCFYLFLSNIYYEEPIRERLEIVFNKNNIFIFSHKLDYVIICKNN